MDDQSESFQQQQQEDEKMLPLKRSVFVDEKTLKIKIKMRGGNSTECSQEEEEEEGLVVDDQSPPPPHPPAAAYVEKEENRVCKVCKKVFKSGRALGGHMRVHNQLLDDDHDFSTNNVAAAATGSNPSTNTNTTTTTTTSCSICGKSFPSMKSLFGHMRCHPERDWRGIQPPTKTTTTSKPKTKIKNTSSSTVSDSVDRIIDSATTTTTVNLVNSLPSWSVRAKRGRKALHPPSPITSKQEEQQIPEAASQLMMLAHHSLQFGLSINQPTLQSDMNKSSTPQSQPNKKDDAARKNFEAEKGGDANGGSNPKSGGRNSSDGEESSDDDYEDESKYYYTDYKSSYAFASDVARKKKKKKLKLSDIETLQQEQGVIDYKHSHSHTNSDRFKCATCNKSFPSHQALGGHRSSHYKGKTCLPDEFTFPNAHQLKDEHQYQLPTQFNDPTELGFDATVSESKVMLSTHKCQICHKTFSTGQALGGHKRCHWNGPILEAPTSSVASPEEEEEASKTETGTGSGGGRVFNFDLNELPAMEDDDDEGIKQPADYASSSYNSVT